MNQTDPQGGWADLPEAGEEIHLPGPSTQPLLITVAITLALVGVTFHPVVLVAGLVLTVWLAARWIRECRADVQALPLDH